MICSPCRLGGYHTTEAENLRLTDALRRQMQDAADVWHGRCPGGTWCDCQCRTDASAVNPVYRVQGTPQ